MAHTFYPKPCGVIAVLTDFGLDDPYVAAMKAVAFSICNNVKIVDITHNVNSYDVETAALILYMVYKYFPRGTVFVAVVDPGVGSDRRAIAIATTNYIFIGPDNGILIPAAKSDNIVDVRLLENDSYFRKPISRSFHGRDVFMPVASYIACGAEFENLGRRVDVSSLIDLDLGLGCLEIENGCVQLKVLHVDKFGNIMLSILFEQLKRLLNLNFGMDVKVYVQNKAFWAKVEEVFSIVPRGTLVIYENSFGLAELAINQGSAKDVMKVVKGSILKICRN